MKVGELNSYPLALAAAVEVFPRFGENLGRAGGAGSGAGKVSENGFVPGGGWGAGLLAFL